MIDFHSHILPGLDDGINNFEETIQTLNEAKDAGFTKVIATTHYCVNLYTADEKQRKVILEQLNKSMEGIEVILGNEIFINDNIDELIKEKNISTINNSKYILFEIPFDNEYYGLKNCLLDLISKGYKLVLAHPERYKMFQENPKKIEEILDLGVYLQSNYLSIQGFYGKKAQKLVQILYKHNMISFLGTDVHKSKVYYPNLSEAIEKIISIIGEDVFEEISHLNPELVINNQEIDFAEYVPIEKNFLGIYK